MSVSTTVGLTSCMGELTGKYPFLVRACEELVTIVVTGPDADVPDREAGNGDGDQALSLDLQGHGGPSWDWLVQGDLHIEGDGLPGGDDQGEGLHRDVVQGEHVRVCSITESNIQLVQLEVPGGDHGGAGEESGEDLHDAGAGAVQTLTRHSPCPM